MHRPADSVPLLLYWVCRHRQQMVYLHRDDVQKCFNEPDLDLHKRCRSAGKVASKEVKLENHRAKVDASEMYKMPRRPEVSETWTTSFHHVSA